LKRIAIFGGTFDPIHTAHLVVARRAIEECALDKLLFIPASHPPHKATATVASYEDRCRMVDVACAGEPRCEVSRLEEGDGTSYSIITIEKLRAESAPGDRLFFVIGADAFAEIQSWYRSRDVIAAVEFIVVTRPGNEYTVPEGARVHRLDTITLPVSSTQIREQLAAGRTVAELPAPVSAYIRRRGLYRQGYN